MDQMEARDATRLKELVITSIFTMQAPINKRCPPKVTLNAKKQSFASDNTQSLGRRPNDTYFTLTGVTPDLNTGYGIAEALPRQLLDGAFLVNMQIYA